MSDYIKREDAITLICSTESEVAKNAHCDAEWFSRIAKRQHEIIDIIRDMPSADVAPVRHGRWEVVDAEEPRRYGCSACKRLSWHMDNYCPNCGARMDGDSDETD